MAPFRAALDDYHDQTQPSDWLEALTKAYVGDSIADDFVREVARFLEPGRPRPRPRGAARHRGTPTSPRTRSEAALAGDPSDGQPAVDVGAPPRR